MPFFLGQKNGSWSSSQAPFLSDFTAGFIMFHLWFCKWGIYTSVIVFFVEEHDDAYGWTIERVVVTISLSNILGWGAVLTSFVVRTFNYVIDFSNILHGVGWGGVGY